MTKSFFFYGITGDIDLDVDPTWKVLFEHFKKLEQEDEKELARADDDGMPKK